MRAGAGFSAQAVVTSAAPSVVGGQPHSAWHSPVPYLFGGLAAMLGLIAFALLILACSYWKLSGYLEREDGGGEGGDAESGGADGKPGGGATKIPAAFAEGIVVIMAGDVKPTFLATPISSRASSFGDNKNNGSGGNDKMNGLDGEKKPDGGSDGDARVSIQTQDQNQEQRQEQ